MNSTDLARLKTWFSEFCTSFTMPEDRDPRPYIVKEEHTRRVCENIVRLAAGLALDAGRVATAQAVALLHDAGRFPQYRQYGTFRDGISVNHAALSAKVMVENGVLERIPEKERKAVTDAVALHNVFTVPGGLDEETLLFTRLIRDADKLDIWRIFIEYYRTPAEDRSDTIGLSLPRTPGYSADVLACLKRGEMVNNSLIRNESDFKLLQLSWAYDLNFPGAFSLMAERGYIDDLAATLPKGDAVSKAVDGVRDYVERKKG